MDDLISRKALIAEYDRVHIGPPGGARKLIEDAPAVQQWIPASEPPKDTYEYWIAYKAGGDYYYSTGYYDGKCWCSVLTHHKIPVTHWMPLPQPPKEG